MRLSNKLLNRLYYFLFYITVCLTVSNYSISQSTICKELFTKNGDTLIVERDDFNDSVKIIQNGKMYVIEHVDECNESFNFKSLSYHLDTIMFFPPHIETKGFFLIPILLKNRKVNAIGSTYVLAPDGDTYSIIKKAIFNTDFNLFFENEIEYKDEVYLEIIVNLNTFLIEDKYHIPLCLD